MTEWLKWSLHAHLVINLANIYGDPTILDSWDIFSSEKWKSLDGVQLFVTPWTVHGILQARILEWVAFPFSRGSSQPRDWTQVSHIAGGILYQLSHKRSPRILEWVAYPFSSGSYWPRNQTRVSCIASGFFTNWAISEALVSSNKQTKKKKKRGKINFCITYSLSRKHTQSLFEQGEREEYNLKTLVKDLSRF